MDKVRFTIGDTHVWQGFHDGEHDHGGARVWVTADTLSQVAAHRQSLNTSDFDRKHNAPFEDWETLAFGSDEARLSPVDGTTPLYRLGSNSALIVQRFNGLTGRTYDRIGADGVTTKGFFGQWSNEETIDGFVGGFSDMTDDFEPECHGFVIDAEGWAAGITDAPPIDTERAKGQREAVAKKVYVHTVRVELSDGSHFQMTQEPEAPEETLSQSGTSYSGPLIPTVSQLENRINDALIELDLFPDEGNVELCDECAGTRWPGSHESWCSLHPKNIVGVPA